MKAAGFKYDWKMETTVLNTALDEERSVTYALQRASRLNEENKRRLYSVSA